MSAVIAVELLVFSAMAFGVRNVPQDGIVVRPGAATLTVAKQKDAFNSLNVAFVRVPSSAWVVVQPRMEDGSLGSPLGMARVPAGESRDVKIPVDGLAGLPGTAVVSLMSNGGQQQSYEFDMNRMSGNPDKPFIAAGRAVTADMEIAPVGVANTNFTAVVESASIAASGTDVLVPRAYAPAASWLVVTASSAEPGGPAKVVGAVLIPEGETRDLSIPIETPAKGSSLRVTMFADAGKPGTFEFDFAKAAASPDKPYLAGMAIVSAPVKLQ